LREVKKIKEEKKKSMERLRVKAGEGESLTHTRRSVGMGCLRRGKWIRDEKFVSGRGVSDSVTSRVRCVWKLLRE